MRFVTSMTQFPRLFYFKSSMLSRTSSRFFYFWVAIQSKSRFDFSVIAVRFNLNHSAISVKSYDGSNMFLYLCTTEAFKELCKYQ